MFFYLNKGKMKGMINFFKSKKANFLWKISLNKELPFDAKRRTKSTSFFKNKKAEANFLWKISLNKEITFSRKVKSKSNLFKSKKAMAIETLVWWLIAIGVLVIAVVLIVILKYKLLGIGSYLKSLFR